MSKVKINLTKRQKQMIVLICEQMTMKEIAALMHISKRTLEGHKYLLMRELEVKNTVGIVLWAVRNGYYHVESFAKH